jgi:hypothetical protein
MTKRESSSIYIQPHFDKRPKCHKASPFQVSLVKVSFHDPFQTGSTVSVVRLTLPICSSSSQIVIVKHNPTQYMAVNVHMLIINQT